MVNPKDHQRDNTPMMIISLVMAIVLLMFGLVGYIDSKVDKQDEMDRSRDAQDVVQCSEMCTPHGVLSWSHEACVCQEAKKNGT